MPTRLAERPPLEPDISAGEGVLRSVSLTLAAPEFGPRRIYANLGRAAGQDSEDAYAIIWNPDN